MNRTRWPLLLALVVLGAGVGFPSDALFLSQLGNLLPISLASSIGIVLSTVLLGIWGWLIKDRLPQVTLDDKGNPLVLRANDPLPALHAARTAAIAMAAARAGAFLAGLYAGLALFAVGHWSLAISHGHAINAALNSVSAIALAVVGWWVERKCTLPPPSAAEKSAA